MAFTMGNSWAKIVEVIEVASEVEALATSPPHTLSDIKAVLKALGRDAALAYSIVEMLPDESPSLAG